MGVDNNSTAASHLYSAMLLQARKHHVPVVGIEISLLGNKQTLGASLADAYAVKTETSRTFVVREDLASPRAGLHFAAGGGLPFDLPGRFLSGRFLSTRKGPSATVRTCNAAELVILFRIMLLLSTKFANCSVP